MLLRAINTQPVRCNLKLVGSQAESQKREDPNQDPNSVGRETLQGPYIHRLGTT